MASQKSVIGIKSIKLTKQDFPEIHLPELSEAVRKAIVDSKVKSLQAFLDSTNPTTVRNNIYQYWGIKPDTVE
jgi:hypothetical protein